MLVYFLTLKSKMKSLRVTLTLIKGEQGAHWIANINDNCFQSYGWQPPKLLSESIIKRSAECIFFSITKSRIKNTYCAAYCFDINY